MNWLDIHFSHLKDRGQTYLEHARWALYAGLLLLWAAITSIIHAVIPVVFVGTSEEITHDLSKRASQRRK